MSTLLERAKALISSKPAALGALVIVPLANAAMTGVSIAAEPYSFYSGLTYFTSYSGSIADFTVSSGCGATATATDLSLFTTAPISISGGTYQAADATSLNLEWTGTLDTSAFPLNASAVEINYDFSIDPYGSGSGTVSWALDNDIGGIPLDVSSSSGYSGGIADQIQGTLLAPVTSTTFDSKWSTELEVSWTNESSTAELSISVPEGASIDLSEVPEPASLGVVGVGAIGLLTRRRRRA